MIRAIASATALVALCAAPALGSVAWDEGVDGDLSNFTDAPTSINPLMVGSNTVTGTVGGAPNPVGDEFRDAFTFTVGAGQTVAAINLVSYVTAGGNTTSGFNVATGTSWDGDFLAPNFIDSALLSVGNVGTNLLDQGVLGGSLGAGDYTIGIFEGTPGQAYSIDIVLVPAPGAAALAGLAGLAAVRRRRSARPGSP